jgi:NADH dehydrogenase
VQADITNIDLDQRVVTGQFESGESSQLTYDQLVIALGGVTNTSIIPGSENAMTFKTLGDAIYLRNHTIQRFEAADVESDPQRKRRLLTFVVIGAGFVGIELVGELTTFIDSVAKIYPNVQRNEIRFELIEGAGRIAPEFDDELADYAADVLRRRGVNIRVNTKVAKVEPGKVHLPSGEVIEAETVLIATGVVPAPIIKDLPVEKDKRGRIQVEPTMRCKSRPEVWAIGDCALIPDPNGKPYPTLAQHALREARQLAKNITAVIENRPPEPFVYHTKGTLAALGHFKGIGRVYKLRIKGFIAWWVWRTYYLFQMPRWDRRLRIILDWTVSLLFRSDVVQLDLFREQQEIKQTQELRDASMGREHVSSAHSDDHSAAHSRQFQIS